MGSKRKKLIITIIPLIISIMAIFYQVPIARISSESLTKLDKFGIMEIYSTKLGGREWFIDMNKPTEDPGFNPGSNILGNWMVHGR